MSNLRNVLRTAALAFTLALCAPDLLSAQTKIGTAISKDLTISGDVWQFETPAEAEGGAGSAYHSFQGAALPGFLALRDYVYIGREVNYPVLEVGGGLFLSAFGGGSSGGVEAWGEDFGNLSLGWNADFTEYLIQATGQGGKGYSGKIPGLPSGDWISSSLSLTFMGIDGSAVTPYNGCGYYFDPGNDPDYEPAHYGCWAGASGTDLRFTGAQGVFEGIFEGKDGFYYRTVFDIAAASDENYATLSAGEFYPMEIGVVPEPSSLALTVGGLAILGLVRRRKDIV